MVKEKLLDPSGNLPRDFMKIIKSITIKYFSKAKEFETMESKLKADEYLNAVNNLDTFYSYIDYTTKDFESVGFYRYDLIDEYKNGNTNVIPEIFHEPLLKIRRQRTIDNFEEQNDYYRLLNGFPPLESKNFYYITEELAVHYGINRNIPVHKIQDYYNKIEDGKGDYLISVIEGSGYIDKLITAHPEDKYLNYIGSNRIDLTTARNSKNFQIIQMRKTNIRQSILDTFVRVYEQCREYFVKTIYMAEYSKFIECYDNFIAMSIMIMTLQHMATNQISLGIKRDFFDIYAVRELYILYNVPFNLNIDEETQSAIVQNLNLLIQNKATDKVIYNIAYLLGFTNINVYKYYLTKDHKMDVYDVPIFKYTTRFNSDTGETSVVPDYKAMYDLYFQKYELRDEDFMNSFDDRINRAEYDDIVSNDPFWWEDQNLYDRLWETEFNFVESKYLSLGVSYSMTEVIFENIVFLKMILRDQELFNNLILKLPRISGNNEIPLFDVIVLLLCLTASKHKLYGEVISIPTQVINVVDYIENTERSADAPHDTFLFNYNYFFNPKEYEDKTKMDKMKSDLQKYINDYKNNDKVETMGYNFEYFSLDNPEREKNITEIKNILGTEDFEKFIIYINKISSATGETQSEKIQALNDMFTSIRGLYNLISFCMSKTEDRHIYESLKRIYKALFITKEVNDVFKINFEITDKDTGKVTTYTRTAWTYFEYLYHKNPKLYSSVFYFNIEEELDNYNKNNEPVNIYKFEEMIAHGDVYLNYGKLITTEADESNRDETLYTYINHVVSRLELVIHNLQFMHMMNDSSTPLENLLLQLVRFFKSYTVDILGLDVIYVMDFKSDNTIRLFDEIAKIRKIIQSNEELRLSYSDAINTITATLYKGECFSLTDDIIYTVRIKIDEMLKSENYIGMNDLLNYISKIINIEDSSLTKLFDTVRINSSLQSNDNMKLSDRVYKLWYSD